MRFSEVVDQAIEFLRQRERVSYRALKREFDLDDEALEDLKAELIDAKRLARDEEGKVLVWAGAEQGARSKEQGARGKKLSTQSEEVGKDTPQLLSSVPSSVLPASRAEGERRQLTVMFIDLVGSTTLSQQLDPEDYHARVVAYQAACQQIVARYEGYIAQYLGDGILVYCGYPTAHEDDAIRAVRSGLEIVSTVRDLKFTPSLQVRIGIHTGPVVVGEIGAGGRSERLALGETPNIAARVQGVAEPDTVVISQATSQLVHGFFTCEALGPQKLKNVVAPLELYRVQGEGDAHSRFEVSVQRGLTPLVGREAELGVLRQRWEQAKAGDGQAVLLSGEPGIGKSRLVQQLKEHVSAERAIHIEFRCSPYHQNTALYPITEHLQRLLQFAREDSPEAKLKKLEDARGGAYGHTPRQSNAVPLLAALLSLPHPAGYPPITVSPQKQKQLTLEALVAWLLEEATRTVVSGAWEDLHWADPSTLEVLTLLLDQVPTTRLLAVLTFRPEFNPPWGNRSHLSQMTLSRLGRPHVEAMVEQVTRGKVLPTEVLQQIVSKTDGVPLFVEELTKTVVESGLLRTEGDRYVETHRGAPIPPLAIPSTLQDSLMARLDRLAPVKEIAQLGATLGREFSYELLQAVSPVDEETLQQGLKQLVEAELLYQRGLLPHATYLFKHALIQDTAYQSLLKSKRQQYHQKIAQVLEERFADTKETQPELLAHHYTEAGLVEQAIPYWQRAGQQASQRSTYVEASSYLRKGLELLRVLSDTPERTQQELFLQTTLGQTLAATKGFAASEVEEAYARALELSQQMGETPQLFPVLYGLRAFYNSRAEYTVAQQLGKQLLSLAQTLQDRALLLQAHQGLGSPLCMCGEFTEALEHFDQALALYDPQQDRSLAFLQTYSQNLGAWALLALGYLAQAQKRNHEAFMSARALPRPFERAYSLFHTALFHLFLREGQEAKERAEEALNLTADLGFSMIVAWATITRGWALAEQGEKQEGIKQMRQGLTALRSTGTKLSLPLWLGAMAEAYGKVGQAREGLELLAEALAAVHETGEGLSKTELYRIKGELLLAQEKEHSGKIETDLQGEAETCFLKAIEIAQQQQAKFWELRASTSLARLWLQQGKASPAHKMLAEVYNWFTEGFDTKDLQEAKALLKSLVSSV